MCMRVLQTVRSLYLEYFPAHIPLLSDLGQFCLQSNTLLPVHLCQTMGLLQILLQCLMKYIHLNKGNKKLQATPKGKKSSDILYQGKELIRLFYKTYIFTGTVFKALSQHVLTVFLLEFTKEQILPSSPPSVSAQTLAEALKGAGRCCCWAATFGPALHQQAQPSSDGCGRSPDPSAAGPSPPSSSSHEPL